MSVSSPNNRDNYVGNGAVSSYPYTFRIFAEDDLEVVQAWATSGVWTESTLVLNTDYTVAGVGDANGGSVTLTAGVLATGRKLAVRRKQELKQETDIKNAGDFMPKSHENIMDQLVMIAQTQDDEFDRTIKLHVTDASDFDVTLPAGADSQGTATIAVNADGDGFTWGPKTTDLSNAASAAADAEAARDLAETYSLAAAASETAAAASQVLAGVASDYVANGLEDLDLSISSVHTSDSTLSAGAEVVRVNPTADSVTLTLPAAAVTEDERKIFKNVSASTNEITIVPNGGETIDSENSLIIDSAYGFVGLLSNGVDGWLVIH